MEHINVINDPKLQILNNDTMWSKNKNIGKETWPWRRHTSLVPVAPWVRNCILLWAICLKPSIVEWIIIDFTNIT